MADVDGWQLIGQDGDTSASEGALSRPVSPCPPPPAGASSSCSSLNEHPAQVDTVPSACCSSNGGASPASERLADSVLGQPFPLPPAGAEDALQLGDERSLLPVLSPFQDQAGKLGPFSSLAVHAAVDHDGERSEEVETVMSLQALSGEGSLEGFHDPVALAEVCSERQGDAAALDNAWPAASPHPCQQHGWLSWLEQGLGALTSILAYIPSKVASVWRACAAELHEEVKDLRRVLAHTKQYFSQEVTKGSGKVACVMKGRAPRATTLVPLLSLSTIIACCGLVHFMARCQRLNCAVQQRERELSRLILKVLNLQEALQQVPRRAPILRHTGIVPGAFPVSSCML